MLRRLVIYSGNRGCRKDDPSHVPVWKVEMTTEISAFRTCLRDPIPEIAEAAHLLDEGVSAHLAGRSKAAEDLISQANMPAIRDWTESIWGKKSPHVRYRPVESASPAIPREQRVKDRMPTASGVAQGPYGPARSFRMMASSSCRPPPGTFGGASKPFGAARGV